jgi:murein DD-endopeptidase MepM/ murein hydrolase activator NlpD
MYNFSGGSGGGTSGGTGSPSPSAFTPEGITSLLVQENIVKDGVVHRVGWGRYWEDRNIYTSEHFTKGEEGESRTLHLGVDLEGVAGTPVFAPVSGFVHSVGIDTSELGYGPTIVLEHRMRVTLKASGEGKEGREEEEEVTFYSLYGHLSRASVFVDTPFSSPSHPLTPLLPVGARVEKGAQIARLGSPLKGENGGWWPHVHFQLNLELGMGGWKGDYPGVCRPCDAPAYSLITCDPNLLLRCPFVQPIGWDGKDKGEDVKVASIV